MAELLWRRTRKTDTTASIQVWSDTNGLVSLSGGFTGDSATVDTTTDNGIVLLEVSGLNADTSYSGTITHADASTESIAFKTAPSAGSFNIAWGSCEVSDGRWTSGHDAALSVSPEVFINLGDTPYCNAAKSYYETCTSCDSSNAAAATAANYYCQHRHSWRNPGLRNLGHGTSLYMMGDDHEWPGDNWDHTLTQANDGSLTLNQAEADNVFHVANQARRSYTMGNPANSDAEAGDEFPTGTLDAGTPESNYPSSYFRFTIADAEFFVLDCITHRSPIAATDDAAKTMLGSKQLDWLKTRLLASTKTFKVILTGKSLVGTTNTDTYDEYKFERNILLKFMLASTRVAGDTSTYGTDDVTGVIWLSGDQHTPHVSAASISDGANYDFLDVCACPIGTALNASISEPGGERIWTSGESQVFGKLHIEGSEYMEASIVSIAGKTMWSGRIVAGSNAVSYPALSVSI